MQNRTNYGPGDGINQPRRIIHEVLAERLTPTEHRRVDRLYGLDGMGGRTEREVARTESVAQVQVQRSRESALERLRGDARLWLLNLLIHDPGTRINYDGCAYCRGGCSYVSPDYTVTESGWLGT